LNVLVVEIGGGSTDISFLKNGELLQSTTYPLGAVRLRQDLLGVKGDLKQRIRILERQIKNTIRGLAASIPFQDVQEVIALGGDVRFAARQISGESENNFWIVSKKDFVKFSTEIVRYDVDDLVTHFSIGYPQAETLVPALLGYRAVLEQSKAERVHVLSVSIRAGILLDMARKEFGKELESFTQQIVASARTLAAKYHSNQQHIEQVRILSLSLFDQLQSEHGLDPRDRLFLEIAALLHNTGYFISNRGHHKHTYYIISSSEVFGLSRGELNVIANIARYHRKALPNASHLPYVSLNRESRMTVSKLAAILRVADALDQDYSSKVKKVRLIPDEGRYVLEVEADGDLVMESLAVQKKSDLFQSIFGKAVVLRQGETKD
jgi:exopolyphosphatase/guanosine-5'-triphosphate,3'-diphosphate pyrophosphatase